MSHTLKDHCRSCFDLYGAEGKDIHQWMDAPSQLMRFNHRSLRHNLKLIPKKFIDKYGKELAEAIMTDHIIMDKKDTTKKETQEWSGETLVFSKADGSIFYVKMPVFEDSKERKKFILNIHDKIGKGVGHQHLNEFRKLHNTIDFDALIQKLEKINRDALTNSGKGMPPKGLQSSSMTSSQKNGVLDES